jgi:hypothetical protein
MKKIVPLFFVLGLVYFDIEIIYRAMQGSLVGIMPGIVPLTLAGWSSAWMILIGGFIAVALGGLNEINWIRKNLNVFSQCLLGTIIAVACELGFGFLFNVLLGLHLWDYSKQPFNFCGQICLLFGVFWLLICPFAFWLDDLLRHVIYKKGNTYSLWKVYKSLFKFWEKLLHYQEIL